MSAGVGATLQVRLKGQVRTGGGRLGALGVVRPKSILQSTLTAGQGMQCEEGHTKRQERHLKDSCNPPQKGCRGQEPRQCGREYQEEAFGENRKREDWCDLIRG